MIDGNRQTCWKIIGVGILLLALDLIEYEPVILQCFRKVVGLCLFAVRTSGLFQCPQVVQEFLLKVGDLPVVYRVTGDEVFLRILLDGRGELFHSKHGRSRIHVDFRQIAIDCLHLMNDGKLVQEDKKSHQHHNQDSGVDLA